MKATLKNLNDILFEQIERLNDDDLKGDALDEQLKKTKLINASASAIIENSKLLFEAAKYKSEFGLDNDTEILKITGFTSKTI